MAFRKLKYKNVQATRSNEVLKEGELAIDGSSLYAGDGATTGGVVIGGSSGSGTMPLTLIKTLTANYTVVTADHGYYIRMNSSSNLTVTLVSDSTENIPIGSTMIVSRLNSGDVTFVAGSGATVLAIGTLTMSVQNGKVTVMKTAANTWEINGDLRP